MSNGHLLGAPGGLAGWMGLRSHRVRIRPRGGARVRAPGSGSPVLCGGSAAWGKAPGGLSRGRVRARRGGPG